MIYFDNAATSYPKPESVRNAVSSVFSKYGANPGRSAYQMARDTALAVYNVRSSVADFFGCGAAENVIFTKNCTEALNTVIRGILKKGDHAVISGYEHNSVLRAVISTGCDYSVAEFPCGSEKNAPEAFEKKIRKETKMIICTHASNLTGMIMPVEAIGEVSERHKIFFCVDAAQSAGVLPIDMRSANIDALCCAAHKGLLAPSGTGLLILGENVNPADIFPLTSGGTGSDSNLTVQPDYTPDRFEAGTLNTTGIIGIGAGLDYIKLVGREKIYISEIKVAQHIYDVLRENGSIILYAPRPTLGKSCAVIPFNIKGRNCEEVCDALAQLGIAVRGGLHCAPLAHRSIGTEKIGAVRISIGHASTIEEADKLIAGVYSM